MLRKPAQHGRQHTETDKTPPDSFTRPAPVEWTGESEGHWWTALRLSGLRYLSALGRLDTLQRKVIAVAGIMRTAGPEARRSPVSNQPTPINKS